MNVQAKPPQDRPGKRAYILLRTIEELEKIPGGVTTDYGVDQCNQLMTEAGQLLGDDPDFQERLAQLRPLTRPAIPMYGRRVAAEAYVLLAELKALVRAFLDHHMDQREKKRLGLSA